jgi:predicted ATP-dependent endonuclease of OLD family
VEDLSIISNLEIETIKSSNDRKKIDHKTQLNIDINEEFGKFWVQDLSKMFIEWDNEKLSFWILEDGHHYEPEIRSQGKRWFLAFYVKVTARARENFNVILIDEPGLYLHAQAQKDVLNKLEDASEDAQIIFSTHSPYLIEADKLERIRLVQRTSAKGTTVENKIHKVADKETLTPILTAIGLEMTNSFSHIDRVNNFIIEGPSDFYFLQAFKKLTNTENINFIYGGGSGNMPKVGTILQGWGCNVFYLYDNDQGLKDALKNIKSDWITTTQEMIAKIPVEGAIEDIFSRDDYKKYVLRDEKTITKNTNSEYAKNSKRDKVLDAKLFLEYVNQNSVSLDKITENNIKKLIEILEAKFKKNF